MLPLHCCNQRRLPHWEPEAQVMVPLFVLMLKVTTVPEANLRVYTAPDFAAGPLGTPSGFSNSSGHQRVCTSCNPEAIQLPLP